MSQIGYIIKRYRNEMNISIDALSRGICSKSNLSRIENGEQTPTRAVYEAFMQRLSKPHDIYPSLMGKRDVRIYKEKYEITNCIADRNYEKAGRLLRILEREKGLENIYNQFILNIKAILYEYRTGNMQESLKLYQQALEISIHNFNHKKMLTYLLTKDEINIINCIAICIADNGDLNEAITIAYALKRYHEVKYTRMKNYVGTYAMVLSNLAEWLRKSNKYKESVKVCNVGIEACMVYDEFKIFPLLLYRKGRSLFDMNMISESKTCMSKAYYFYRAMGNEKFSKIVKRHPSLNGYDI